MALQVRPQQRRESTSQAPQRWEPIRELEYLHDQMGRLMESVWSPVGAGDGAPWIPLADIEETDDAWIVEAELPGVRREDIDVELRDDELVITGEMKEKERKGVLRRRTRKVGDFEYRVTLPGQPQADGIDASLHDGELTVRVPKAERERPQRIAVKAD